MANKKVRVGSRESLLAVKQAEIVISNIKKHNPEIEVELITLKTKGDKILDKTLDKIGGKGLFTKELEERLYNYEIDIAIHSYKDMPYEEVETLPVVALSKRKTPFDVLVLPKDVTEININKPIGSSSLRRTIQFKELQKNVEIKPIRGNVITRLDKLDKGEFSGLILAEAGLIRLSLQNRISKIFTLNEIIPSASQGILAVQGRKDEDYSYLNDFHNIESEIVSKAERQYLKVLNGGCSSPIAVYAEVHGTEIKVIGMYIDTYGNMIKDTVNGNIKDAEKLGEELARLILLKERQV